MSNVLYAVEIAVALGLIIFVHELGHFLAAKWFGVWVRKFALGMGPAIVRWTRGETEYSLRWIPVGGFVDLAGEHPEADEADDPRALCRQPAWQRAIIFSAGVVMNAVLALLLFAVAPIVGVQVLAPVVGEVLPGMPAEEADIRPGDRLLSVNGKKVDSFEDVFWAAALHKAGTSFNLVVERAVAGAEAPERLMKTLASRRAPGGPAPMFGIRPQAEPVIGQMHSEALLHQAGTEEGDRILTLNGKPVHTWRGLEAALAEAPAGPLVLGLERDGKRQDLRVVPAELKVYEFGMKWPTEIAGVESGSPAEKAGIRAGDRVAAIESKPWATMNTIMEVVKALGDDQKIRLTLWRKGKRVDVVSATARKPDDKSPRLGIAMTHALASPVQVGQVDPGGAADRAHIRPGDIVRLVGEDPVKPDDWNDLSERLLAAAGKPVPVQVQRGASRLTTTLTADVVPQERLTLAGAVGRPMYVPLPRIYSPPLAAERGVKHTLMWFGRVYANVSQLLTGQVSSKAMAGPVGIVKMSYTIAGYGFGTFMEFWGMLSVCIVVLNFLPLPPFDGGHVLFLILEKIKGSPFSLKLRTAVWVVGWVGVLLLFVFITWQDITRFLL